MAAVRIPNNWTPTQAYAVIDFLHRLADAIWNHYDEAIDFHRDLERLDLEGQPIAPSNQWNDDMIPF